MYITVHETASKQARQKRYHTLVQSESLSFVTFKLVARLLSSEQPNDHVPGGSDETEER